MTQSSRSVEAIMRSTYPLQIAARCTEKVELICQKNSLSFVDLLRPFSSISGSYQLKDVQGHQYTVRNVSVKFTAPLPEPIPDSKLRLDLGNCVKCQTSVSGGSGEKGASSVVLWYEKYRETFLHHLKQSDHECIQHYVCVVMVVSSIVSDPLDSFSKLYTAQKQSERESKYPKWLTPHIFYYYLLLHDPSEGGDDKAKDNFEKMEANYGKGSCFFLQINSRAPGSPGKNIPDLWSEMMRPGGEETDSDEVDGGFKLKFKKAKKPSKESPPMDSHKGGLPVIKETSDSKDAQEEPTLFSISSSDSDLASPTPHTITPGNDPLTQENSATIHHALSSADFSESEGKERYGVNGAIEGGGKSGGTRYGQCLTLEDHKRLAGFVEELVGKRLLTHISDVLKNLNEWLMNRRSVRRWSSFAKFMKMVQGPSTPTGDGPGYAPNSPEVQLRQLADLAFFVQNYSLAFQTYHQIKKDFQSTSAWHYYAAAVEMCAVAAYMCSSTKREVVSYLEEATSVYTLSCKAPYHALRCSLLLCEIFKERGLYRELTQLYVRMTTEDDDLRSALCLEQAGYAFLRTVPSMERKFALHLILAGHRFARSTQRVHSTRVYKQALEVYKNKGWTLAEDYIHFSLARHSFTLHRLSEAKAAFEALLSHESLQSPAQQLLNLKEYIFVYKQVLALGLSSSSLPVLPPTSTLAQSTRVTSLPILPLPFVNSRLTRVTFLTGASPESLNRPHPLAGDDQSNSNISLGQYLNSKQQQIGHSFTNLIIGASDYDPSKMKASKDKWEKLEIQAAAGVGGVLHENFRPSVLLMDESTDNSSVPVCAVNEPVSVGLVLRNPLRVPLLMTNVTLVWDFSSSSLASFSTSDEDPPPEARSDVLEVVLLKPEEERVVTLHITPLKEGQLRVTGFLYNLCVDSSQSDPSSNSPVVGSHHRPNLPSMAVTSQDVLYQKRQSRGVSDILATGIQGRVDIETQGQRLNSTKDERAAVVYGVDHRLSWNVAAPMPKIVACLSSIPTSLCSGEVCRVGVEVFNCGQVPLNSLRITSSLGKRVLLEQESGPGSTGDSIYPSSLLSPINKSPPPTSSQPHAITSSHCVELPLPGGRLEPGAGVSARLIMQGESLAETNEDGEIPFHVVVYYEPALVSANSKLNHRVLRHSSVLKLNESLLLKSTAVHGQCPHLTTPTSNDNIPSIQASTKFDMNQLVVTVEAENKLSPGLSGEVRVTQVSCVSQRWKLSKMDKKQGLLCLQPSESGVVQLKATRLDTPTSDWYYSDVPLGPTVIPSNSFPTGELLRGDELFKEGQSRDQITLVVFWQALVPGEAERKFSYGHQTVSAKFPQSMSSLAQISPSSQYDIVKFYLEHPTVHPFPQSTAGLCQIPVRVVLQNCCESSVTTMVEFMQPKDSTQQKQGESKRPAEPTFFWGGGTCRRHLTLLGNSTTDITVFANFGKPGVYNLNTLRVLVAKGSGGGYNVQRWQRTSYITIA